jgi:deoxyribonuclease IV
MEFTLKLPLFGPAGNEDAFYEVGYKNTSDMFLYIKNMGLSAYEYQCGRGINLSVDTANKLKESAQKSGITLSLHAPYYISLSSVQEELREKSITYILQSAKIADAMGAKRVIVHSGSCAKISRAQAIDFAKITIQNALMILEKNGLSHIILCPETMGKINQLGTVDEVLELCSISEMLIPCIDFGHVNAYSQGGLKNINDYNDIFIKIKNTLGEYRFKNFHSHFSKIEYTVGGEKRHLTFEDTTYGPDFEPVAELTYKYGCSPIFICESAGTQASDAAIMMQAYKRQNNN